MTNIPRLSRDNILFVFIDLQVKLLAGISNAAKIISRNELLMEAANVFGLPYITTTQYRSGLGEIVEPLLTQAKTPALDKTTFSCPADADIEQQLKSYGRKSVAISGVETHICVMQTALDLLDRGYSVSIVADAVGSRTPCDHELGMKRMESSGALLVTSEMLIYELLGRSDSPDFKRILPSIKRLSS